MSSPPDQADAVRTILAALDDSCGLSDTTLQSLFAAAVRCYAARADAGASLPPFPHDAGVTATDAMIAADAILKAMNLQLFELSMWQAWSGRH